MEPTATRDRNAVSQNGNGYTNGNGNGAGFERRGVLDDPTAATLPGSVPTAVEIPNIDAESIAAELEHASAEESLRWAIDTFHPGLYIASSFQKTTSVTVHIATQINPDTRFFYLDTDVLFPETYETKDALEERYGITFERYGGISLDEQAAVHGDALWNRDPDACCNIRKVEPMGEALSTVDCWVSGIRREDGKTRAKAAKFGWDKRFGLWKLNPLANWTIDEVWDFIREHDIPYNPLHDQGYPSIGCTHCTIKPGAGEDERAGRWAGSNKSECGLHG